MHVTHPVAYIAIAMDRSLIYRNSRKSYHYQRRTSRIYDLRLHRQEALG
jgi:hypothetical protein